jgi:hypothetical protein
VAREKSPMESESNMLLQFALSPYRRVKLKSDIDSPVTAAATLFASDITVAT